MGRKLAYMSGFRPINIVERGGGEGVAQVDAGAGLLVVGAVAPGSVQAAGFEAGGRGRCGDPSGGVALGGAAGDGGALFVKRALAVRSSDFRNCVTRTASAW